MESQRSLPLYISDGDWEEFEMRAMGIIRLSLAHEVKYWVLSKTSPHELRKKLEKIYMSIVVIVLRSAFNGTNVTS